MILAGDIGGTKTNVALFNPDFTIVEGTARTYVSAEARSLSKILEQYRREFGKKVQAAGFGVAGPVVEGTAKTTNLPWIVESKDLARQLKIKHVALVNDLVANAYGISVLKAGDVVTLSKGKGNVGTQALVSPGTGLGHAILHYADGQHNPCPSEAGHNDFAARDDEEMELVEFLRDDLHFPRVSYEHVLSGPGIANLYRFYRDDIELETNSHISNLFEAASPKDKAAIIAQSAVAKGEAHSPAAEEAMLRFVSILGAQAGNFALASLATGGVYLGGGVTARNAAFIKKHKRLLLDAFVDKGPMKKLLSAISVQVITNPNTALFGAAVAAKQQA